jgi:hypothetical protein
VRPAVSTPTSTGDVGESEETPDGPIRDEAADEDSAGTVASEDAQ